LAVGQESSYRRETMRPMRLPWGVKEDPADFNERRLEEIRLAWNAEFPERTQ
jgi:hypothetical protein